MPRVLVPLAEDFEELEAVSIIDILRRAGITVVTAGLKPGPVRASRGTVLLPDTTLDEALHHDYDMIALPGGMPGAQHLTEDPRVQHALRKSATAGHYCAAICAAPMALAKAGLLEGKRATAYPGFLSTAEHPGIHYTGNAVERDGKIITSRGPGTAMDFALALVETLCGREKRDAVEKGLVR
jgi:4-methyl-5(b-hydroxyethyl)-thiazole monophosphate biosynthesis